MDTAVSIWEALWPIFPKDQIPCTVHKRLMHPGMTAYFATPIHNIYDKDRKRLKSISLTFPNATAPKDLATGSHVLVDLQGTLVDNPSSNESAISAIFLTIVPNDQLDTTVESYDRAFKQAVSLIKLQQALRERQRSLDREIGEAVRAQVAQELQAVESQRKDLNQRELLLSGREEEVKHWKDDIAAFTTLGGPQVLDAYRNSDVAEPAPAAPEVT